jgi:hypothetical protein
METGDRIFWGCILFVGVIFAWLGLLEKYIPLWVGTIAGILAFFALLIYGPRPKEEKEEKKGT